jgi:hypothetical protein
MKLHQLPLVVFSHIREYLVVFTISTSVNSYEDLKNWRNFCNCSHEFEEIKRFYCYYNLNIRSSTKYLTYSEGYGDPIIGRILKSIRNSKLQISLCLLEDDSVTWADEFSDRVSTVHSLMTSSIKWNELSAKNPRLDSLHCLTIVPSILGDPVVRFNFLVSLSVLRLSFSNCNYVDGYVPDLLKTCLELDLSNTKIKDVSMLKHVRKLNLSSCYFVTDVSMLGGLHTLILDNCRGITDISALGNVYSLSISHCDYILNGLSDDNNVEKLTISSNFLRTVSNYRNKRKKILSVFGEFTEGELFLLDGYEKIGLYQNGSLNGLSAKPSSVLGAATLSSVNQLSLNDYSHFHYLRDFPYLSSLTLCRLYPFPNAIDFPSLPALRYLTLDNIVHLDDFVVHFPLKVLTFSNCKPARFDHALVLHVYNVIELLSIQSSALTLYISESGNGKVNEMISNDDHLVVNSTPSYSSFVFPASLKLSSSSDGSKKSTRKKENRNIFNSFCDYIISFWR